MKVKVSEASGVVLDWLVAKCEGKVVNDAYRSHQGLIRGMWGAVKLRYSTNWAQGGPIIERERIFVKPMLTRQSWRSYVVPESGQGIRGSQYGDTPLIAAMRCYVASKLGDDIEIPKELIAE